jgi:hypothetical protein
MDDLDSELMNSYVKNMYDVDHDITTRRIETGHYFNRTAAGMKFNSESQCR